MIGFFLAGVLVVSPLLTPFFALPAASGQEFSSSSHRRRRRRRSQNYPAQSGRTWQVERVSLLFEEEEEKEEAEAEAEEDVEARIIRNRVLSEASC